MIFPLRKSSGFTLIEVAIVLVIIGLIVGGTFLGQSLIRNSQLQSVVNDIDHFKKAVQMFREKYNYLPGDMPTATNFWGTDATCPGTPGSANAVLKATTCNGNGDGFIGDSTSTAMGNTTNGLESFRAWQQLANANYIDGTYNGTWSSRITQEDPAMNTPPSQVPNNTYLLFYVQPPPSPPPAGEFAANYRHVIVYGQSGGDANGTGPIPPYYPGLTAAEAMALDQKMDDGMPATGNVLSYTNALAATPNCVNSALITATYQAGASGNSCSLIFITGF